MVTAVMVVVVVVDHDGCDGIGSDVVMVVMLVVMLLPLLILDSEVCGKLHDFFS